MKSKEVVVAKTGDLKDGEMKTIKVDDQEILLTRIDGEFHALGAHCTHYGAELEQGLLNGDRIVCPWHHACFHARTGDLLEPPARDALPRYEVKIDGEQVLVKLPEELEFSRVPEMVGYDPKADNRTFVIIGGGAAGNSAAQTLREDGFKGRIVVSTPENRFPYDRPNLSKEYLQGEAEPDWMPLRSADFYEKYGIEVMLETGVLEADLTNKSVKLDNGEILHYDKLLLATGARPLGLNVPGSNLSNIFLLRSYDDSDAIIEASQKASRVVVVGASFIGTETANSLRHRGLDVTVVSRETTPFEHVFGTQIGKMFQRLHEKNGVKFLLNTMVTGFEGNGSVEEVVLDNGDSLEADMVVVGIGVQPVTDYIQGLTLEPDGSVKVDRYFRAMEDVYAAGDIASFPDWHTGLGTRIEHWRTAEQHGRYAAHNMMGKDMEYESVPFFWSDQVGLHFRFVGFVKDWDEIILDGDVDKQDFIAYYVKNNQIHAASGVNRDKEMDAIEELIRMRNMPPPNEIREGKSDIFSHLR